jgi:urea transport system ATP-binding protein
MLLDEPTAGMTRGETERTAELVRAIGRDRSIVVIEHDMEFVRQIDAPVTVLQQGRLLAQGSLAEVGSDPRVVESYLGREATLA